MEQSDTKAARDVYFDGGCPVCRREVAAYRGMTSLAHVQWVDVSRPDADLNGIDPAEALRRFHARRANGEIASGARAFTAVWRNHPRLAPLARLIDRRPLIDIAELAYRGFLRVRRLWR